MRVTDLFDKYLNGELSAEEKTNFDIPVAANSCALARAETEKS